MEDLLKQCGETERQILALTNLIISKQGVEAYVVGGFVRDLVLGRVNKDIDIVCLGGAMEVAKEVSLQLGGTDVHFFKRFGVAQLRVSGVDIEFTNARKESYSPTSRNPDVSEGTLEDDFLRRDFTINALAISLNKNTYGQLLDPFDGVEDIKKQRIVTPRSPDTTFNDDPLRILRSIRFASQLSFQIDSSTWQSLCRHTDRLSIVSKERIGDELNKILLSSVPSVGLNLLDKAKMWYQIIPQMEYLKGVEFVDGRGHKDNFYHTLQVVDNVAQRSDNLWLRWAALLHDIAKPKTKRFEQGRGWTFHGHDFVGGKMVPSIFRKLGLPMNEKMKFVKKLVTLHLRPISLTKDEITDSAIRRLLHDAGDDIEQLMLLCESDITSKRQEKVMQYMSNFQLVRQRIQHVEEKDELRNFKLKISGNTIMRELNLPPCKKIGIIKQHILDAVLDGIIANTEEETLDYMRKISMKLNEPA